MYNRLPVVWFGGFVLLWGLLLAGCQGKGQPPEVAEGTFTAYVEGTLADTITGKAHYRTRNDTLRAFELGRRDGSGLSLEVEPHPLGLHTYEVVSSELFGGRRPGQSPGVMAFLTVGNGRFTADDGTLELTYVDDEEVGAEFSFEMEGGFVGAPVDEASVEVTGVFSTLPER